LRSADYKQLRKKLRSESCGFDRQFDCIFCGHFVTGSESSYSAMTLQIKDTVVKKCHKGHWKASSLLFKTKRSKVRTYADVLDMYVKYIRFNHGSDTVVVFDGYESSTKYHEHTRRMAKTG
jgi:transcription elongation factor Elf1